MSILCSVIVSATVRKKTYFKFFKPCNDGLGLFIQSSDCYDHALHPTAKNVDLRYMTHHSILSWVDNRHTASCWQELKKRFDTSLNCDRTSMRGPLLCQTGTQRLTITISTTWYTFCNKQSTDIAYHHHPDLDCRGGPLQSKVWLSLPLKNLMWWKQHCLHANVSAAFWNTSSVFRATIYFPDCFPVTVPVSSYGGSCQVHKNL